MLKAKSSLRMQLHSYHKCHEFAHNPSFFE